MELKELPEIAELLAEGFLADRIFLKREYDKAREYADAIREAREMIRTGRNFKISHLHKLVRFYDWLLLKYGSKTFKNEAEAESFVLEKIKAIGDNTPDFESFWGWLREITLSETSQKLAPVV
jgi:hypothetical protein